MEADLLKRLVPIAILYGLILPAASGYGAAVAGHDRSRVHLGSLRSYQVRPGESLIEVARKFDVGFNAIVAANPDLDPWIPPAGSTVTLPTAWILPHAPSGAGIVINIPEFRLYYFAGSGSRSVHTFPLGIGEQGRDTPLGTYRVVEKVTRPVWHVPPSIRHESRSLPDTVPPGPDNPLGTHALRLSRNDILIHGTNRPWGIGRRSSHGCLRLYPEDIIQLFRLVPRGTQVTVINQPLKACQVGGRVLLEVHQPVSGDLSAGQAMQLLASKRLLGRVDFLKVLRTIEARKGFPVDVTLVPR